MYSRQNWNLKETENRVPSEIFSKLKPTNCLDVTETLRVRSLQGNLRPRPWCTDQEKTRSLHQGRGLRFNSNDSTDEVKKLLKNMAFSLWMTWACDQLKPLTG